MRTSGRLTRCLIAAMVLAVLGRPAIAQRVVRGVVVDSETSAPVAGAVVSLLGADGRTVRRAITNAEGRFGMTGAGTWTHARVVRIGYRPRDVVLPASRDSTLRITMVRIPALLDAVTVSGAPLCPNSSDHGDAFALWEQARAGLLASIVARETDPAFDSSLVYGRREAPGDGTVHQQTVKRHRGYAVRPFLAQRSGKELVDRGYIADDATGRTFFAPDADVLLDDSFAATHCFHVERGGGAHPHQVGLAFTALENRAGHVDITGVIWVDEAVPGLRSVDFQYTGLEDDWAREAPGGHIEFHTAGNGASFVARWDLRFPIFKAGFTTPLAKGDDPISASSSRRATAEVDEMYVAGGIVTSAHWSDGSTWRIAPNGVSGTVVDHGTLHPVAGALVTFAGTADTAATDSLGQFAIVAMIPGRYVLRAADTTLAAYARDRTDERTVDVGAAGVVNVAMQLPAMSETIAQVCKAPHLETNPAMVAGRVFLPDGSAPASARIKADWRTDYDKPVAGTDLQEVALTREVELDARGRFVVCGVPLEQRIDLHLSFAGGEADTTIVVSRILVRRVEWHPRPW